MIKALYLYDSIAFYFDSNFQDTPLAEYTHLFLAAFMPVRESQPDATTDCRFA